MEDFYPEPIANLPEAELPLPGVRGRLFQGERGQIVFFTIPAGSHVPAHAHGAQWGVVLDGEMRLRIGEQTRTYRKGDTYFIPAGVEHEARFPTDCHILDFFADVDRYAPKG